MQKKDNQKPAHYSELLERNPALKKNWFTRTFVAVIVAGARIHPNDWPRLRLGIYGSPFLLAVFLINYFFAADDTPQYKQTIGLILIFFFTASLPLLFAAAYGHWNKNSIDITGGMKPDFSYLKRYALFWALIGVSFSTGASFFGWFGAK